MPYQNIREEELKNQVARDYFGDFDCTRIIGNVDFCVVPKFSSQQILLETQSFAWMEAKKGKSDIYKSIVQLILTIGKARTFDKELPPAFLGAFDSFGIAFVGYSEIQEVFYQNDFNWNVTPSNHETKEFKQLHQKVKNIIENNSLIFQFQKDDKDLGEFIKLNFIIGKTETSKIQIDKNNFISIYSKWLNSVKPSIILDWNAAKKAGIIDGDFYLADLLSSENETLKEKLYILLKGNYYQVDRKLDEMGMFSSRTTNFNDNQKAHNQFWNRYQRPPRQEYWDYIVERRDLLVPQDVRERKGSFFTPRIWVELSQEYLAKVLGGNWQDEYYIWDCAAGTGNLLAGLTNKYNIFASTLDKQDVDVMHSQIDTMNTNSVSGNGANLLADHCFQFDFLNDNFDDPKVPKSLQNILKDPEKRKKLVIYINPPYAEATSAKTVTGTGDNKSGVAIANKTYLKYKDKMGKASNELFTQFFTRVYFEINGCYLSSFSKMKYAQSSNFVKFRNHFLAEFKKGFVIPADTFDNVKGKFPIGFLIWNLDCKQKFEQIEVDIFDKSGVFGGQKRFSGNLGESINKWFTEFYKKEESGNIGILSTRGNDFQNQKYIYLATKIDNKTHDTKVKIYSSNLIPICIYLAVRHCIKATWLNDRDQFLFPSDSWKTDLEFQSDCLTFALFHSQNRISSKQGINHWIPFTENEVNSREKFDSNFMTDFVSGKIQKQNSDDLLAEIEEIQNNLPLEFSLEAKAVFEAGLEFWKYYHKEPNCNINASLYDIKAYFQGVDDSGRMKNRSLDAKYNLLIGNLRQNLEVLSLKIQPKVYEFGFLK